MILLLATGCATSQRCGGVSTALGSDTARCFEPGGGERFKDCADCPEMVVVPAGQFVMGSSLDEPERESGREDQVRVAIGRPFAIGAFAVTRGEFAAFVAATGYQVDEGCYFWTGTTWEERADRSWRAPGFEQDDRHPVTCVDLKSAKAYTAWLSEKTGKNYRLPSETEREYATRAGTATSVLAGLLDLDPIWPTTTARAVTHRARRASGGRRRCESTASSPMDGASTTCTATCWDWTDDCWNENNTGNPGDGSVRTTGDCTWRVARGGAWNYSPNYLRSAFRYWNQPDNRSGVQGMRVVRAL